VDDEVADLVLCVVDELEVDSGGGGGGGVPAHNVLGRYARFTNDPHRLAEQDRVVVQAEAECRQ
jgi:hypothetical protein